MATPWFPNRQELFLQSLKQTDGSAECVLELVRWPSILHGCLLQPLSVVIVGGSSSGDSSQRVISLSLG